MDDVMEQLHQELDLAGIDRAVDAIVALSMADEMPKALHDEVLIYYIGFPFWDVWTYPISEWRASKSTVRSASIASVRLTRCCFGTGTRRTTQGSGILNISRLLELFSPGARLSLGPS